MRGHLRGSAEQTLPAFIGRQVGRPEAESNLRATLDALVGEHAASSLQSASDTSGVTSTAQSDALSNDIDSLKIEITNLRAALDALVGEHAASTLQSASDTSGVTSTAQSDALLNDINSLKMEITKTEINLRATLDATIRDHLGMAELLVKRKPPGPLTVEQGVSPLAQAVLIAQERSGKQ
jgi:hypothetical protein